MPQTKMNPNIGKLGRELYHARFDRYNPLTREDLLELIAMTEDHLKEFKKLLDSVR